MTKWHNNKPPVGNHSSIHSFAPIYKRILAEVRPDTVFEWGPGLSTDIALLAGACVTSVESEKRWLHEHNPRLIQIYLPVNHLLYTHLADDGKYDVFFVDGRRRVACLLAAKINIGSGIGVAILHDAHRSRYAEGLAMFRYGVFFGDGVAVMCQSEQRWEQLRRRQEVIAVWSGEGTR